MVHLGLGPFLEVAKIVVTLGYLKSNLQSHLTCRYIKKCILIRHTICESFVKICSTKLKCRSLLWYYFSDIGQCCRPAQKNYLENKKIRLFCRPLLWYYFSDIGQCWQTNQKNGQKSGPLEWTKIIYLTFSKYFSLYISWCRLERGHRRRQRQFEF